MGNQVCLAKVCLELKRLPEAREWAAKAAANTTAVTPEDTAALKKVQKRL